MPEDSIMNPKLNEALTEIAKMVRAFPEESRAIVAQILVERAVREAYTVASDSLVFPGLMR